MDDEARTTPLELRAPRGGSTLEIDWQDGTTTHYTHQLLRAFCPCAGCQGHQGDIVFVEGDSSELLEIEEIGNYALRLSWPDCPNGLYSFRYLRELARPSDTPLQERVYHR